MSPPAGRPDTLSAVVVPVEAVEHVVGEHRRRLDPSAPWGVPAHVTVLVPFVPPAAIDDAVLARLGAALATVEAFDCVFAGCAWFDDRVLWLAPEPAAPFRALTAAVVAAFPDHPPYGGAFDDVVPHLTVGERPRATLADLRTAQAAVAPRLPVHARVDRVLLMTGSHDADSWRTVHEFALRTGLVQASRLPKSPD